MRDRSIDVSRGLLVLAMVYGHVLQFFADTQIFPLADVLMDVINLTVFPTFVFCFGATAVLAYLKKPYKKALPGMVKTTLRTLCTFWASGIAYRVLRENKPFAVGTVRRVLQLKDIPGWSEFLISFALYAALIIVAFPLLRYLMKRPWALAAAAAVSFLSCFAVDYDAVQSVHLALLIGGRQFSFFPIVQYMPYFFAGMAYAGCAGKTRIALAILSVLASGAGVYDWIAGGGFPRRFPPEWGWIALPAALVCAVVLMSKLLLLGKDRRVRFVLEPICTFLSHFGSRSLYYLLGSNLILFTMAGKGIVPMLSPRSVLPWTMPIQSPQGAVIWTAVMLAALWFAALLAGRSAPKTPAAPKGYALTPEQKNG